MPKLGNAIISLMEDLSRISTNGSATVKVNSSLCTPEEFESLFNYFSRGTILEHVDLNVKPMQTQLNCGCGYQETIEGDHDGYSKCPSCGRFANIEDHSYELEEPNPEIVGERKSIRF